MTRYADTSYVVQRIMAASARGSARTVKHTVSNAVRQSLLQLELKQSQDQILFFSSSEGWDPSANVPWKIQCTAFDPVTVAPNWVFMRTSTEKK